MAFRFFGQAVRMLHKQNAATTVQAAAA